jgi:hypothetical protein
VDTWKLIVDKRRGLGLAAWNMKTEIASENQNLATDTDNA